MLLGEIMVSFGAEVSGFSSGAALVTAGLIGVGAAIGEAVKSAGDFQAGITNLSTAAGESAGNLGMVGEGVKKIAMDTGTGTKDLISAMFMIESSGQHGAAGLRMLQIAAQGAKTDNAELMVVSKALTGVMAGWPQTVNGAAGAMNELIVASSEGKMHLQDLSKAMSSVIPIAGNAGVSFADVGAAVAMMTNKNTTAQKASTWLAFALRDLSAPSGIAQKAMASVGLSAQDLKDTLSTKGLGATLQQITDAVGKTFPKGSVEATTALKNIMGGASGLNVALSLGGKNLATYEAGVKKIADAARNGGQTVEGWAIVQGNFNTKMDQAKAAVEVLGINLGTMLLPALGRLAGLVAPLVTNFLNWKDKMTVLTPILAGLGAIVLSVLVPALISLAVSAIAAAWPFLLVGAAVAGLVAIFMHFYSTSAPFKAFIDNLVTSFKQLATLVMGQVGPAFSQLGSFMQSTVVPAFARVGSFISGTLWPILQQVGAFIVGTFKPVWDQLVATIRGQLIPVWNSLVSAIQPVLPQLKMFAQFLGAVVGTAIILIISIIGGLIRAFAGILSGVIAAFGGIAQIISGVIKVVSGIIAVFVDIATGNFGKLKSDIGLIFDGIGTIITGFWNMVKGLFQASVGAVIGFISGFKDTIIGIFHNLSNMLVGHSIIPDMINGIVTWFLGLPGRAGAALMSILGIIGNIFTALASAAIVKAQQLVTGVITWLQTAPGRAGAAISGMMGTVMGALGAIAGAALQAGATIVENIASGILGAIGGAIGGAMSAVGSFISSHLPASPAKVGPLRDLQKQGGEISHQIGLGILANMPDVQASLNQLIMPSPSIGNGGTQAQGQGSGGTQTIILQIDGRDLAKALGPHLTQEVRLVQQVRR